jgi:hypothetical protein
MHLGDTGRNSLYNPLPVDADYRQIGHLLPAGPLDRETNSATEIARLLLGAAMLESAFRSWRVGLHSEPKKAIHDGDSKSGYSPSAQAAEAAEEVR